MKNAIHLYFFLLLALAGCKSCDREEAIPVLNADFTMMANIDWLNGLAPFWYEDSIFSESPLRFKAKVIQKDWAYEWTINGSTPWRSPDSSLRFNYSQVPLNQKLPVTLRVWNTKNKSDTVSKTRTIEFYNFTRCTVRNVEKNKSKKVAHLTEIQFIKIEFLHKFYLNYDAQLSGSSK